MLLTILMLQACSSGKQGDSEQFAQKPDSNEQSSTGEPKSGGTLTIMDIAHPENLDPITTASLRAHNIVGMVYNKLVNFPIPTNTEQFSDFTVGPELAREWEISEDGLQYTFHLRDDVNWHDIPPVNGRPFVSDDVVATMKKIQEVGHQAFTLKSVEKIEAPDEHTVVFTLSKPDAAFLSYLANHFMWILPKEAIDGKVDIENTAIGTGPFMLEKFERNVETIFTKNPNYFVEGLPYLDKVVSKIIPDTSTQIAAYRTGQADTIENLSPEDMQNLEGQFDDQVIFKPLYQTNTRIFLNMDRPPFDDLRVRKAISLAVDRKGLADSIWDGGVVAGPIPSHLGDWVIPVEEREELQPYNVEQAKELLAEAGYPDGFDTTIMTTEGYGQQWVRTAEWVLEDLRQIGINAKLDVVEYGTWISDRWPNSKFDMGVSPQFTQLEPDEFFNRYKSDSNLNWFGINDPKLDRMIDEQKVMMDEEKRKEKVHEIQRYIVNEVANPIELSTPYQPTLHRGYVKNFYKHGSYGYIHLRNVWIDK